MGRPQKSNGKIMAALLPVLNPGEHFYTELTVNSSHVYANRLNVKITTETLILLEQLKDSEPKTSKLTKVTIL